MNGKPVRKCRLNGKKIRGYEYLLLSIPFLLLVIAFAYVPLFSWLYAFVHYQIGHRLSDMPFVGLANFAKLLRQRKEIARVLRNTLAMSFLNIICTPLPMIFAIMLNETRRVKFRKFVQTMTTLPNFISWFVVFELASALFASNGLLPLLEGKMGIVREGGNIMGNNDMVWIFQLLLGIWKGLGWQAIIYLAAIAGINEELFDAARVDGASKLQTIRHVTVPGLMPTYMVLLLLQVANLLNNGLDQYFVFYNPSVSDRIEVLDYYVYKVGILVNDYSFSIVIGMLKTVISVILLFTVNGISRRLRGEPLV
ncbi:ABC transporter permease subunit [Lachnoclostridium sp. Marseille-P6806]|uniref:ABC transporter permease subunit n=1 Tax=Lachnoclostridium sp. Marseille-P6806 TaxID=2364793 RepID=UPI00102FDB5B|nr:ABC transporter permease subunit [Lachnoclostridium sp. Marseille-P6806]